MTETPELIALRASLRRLLGEPQLVPLREDGDWRADWHLLVELGAEELFDDESGGGPELLPLAVGMVEELARAMHPAPVHALLPASAWRRRVVDLSGDVAPVVAVVRGCDDIRVREGRHGLVVTGTTDTLAGIGGLSHVVLTTEDGSALVVDLADADLLAAEEGSLDHTRTFHRLRLDGVRAQLVTEAGAQDWQARSRLLLAADTVAVASLAVDRTVAYARERRTFGAPIGRYQAVQHRLVEHAIAVRQMTDLVASATEHLSGHAQEDEQLAVLETFCYERVPEVVSDCIQLTGAIGFTWEYGLHFALRRAAGNAQLAGGVRRARRQLADVAGW